MKKIHLILLAILSGLLLWLAWPARGFPGLLFVAFIPLLFIEDYITQNRHNFVRGSLFLFSYLAFFIWNLLSTWWIYNSSFFGAAMAIVLNSLFMAIVMHFYHIFRRNLFKGRKGYFVLIFFWITFEFLHLNWDLTWSWLNLGNGFANYPQWVQWYEYTGTFGGTAWILGVNILLYLALKYGLGLVKVRQKLVVYTFSAFLVLLIPFAVSFSMYDSYKEKSDPIRIVVVQPNIDPYNEKFGGMTSQEQLDRIISLARQKVNAGTDFLVCPETAIPEGIVEDELDDSKSIDSLKSLLRQFPRLRVVIGISSYKIFKKGEVLSETARISDDSTFYYDVCNTAMYLDTSFNAQLYHKSKLVPGVEKMPFPGLLKPLDKFALNLGGMTGSHGISPERTAFGDAHSKCKVAPVICYESIYGDFVTGYIRNGSNLIFIITNDGWWGDTPGYRQHFQYARLRAIETRRSIARSANTGSSGFINQRGDVYLKSDYWVPGVYDFTLNANDRMTFYSRFGDYLGVISQYVTLAFFVVQLVMLLLNMRFRTAQRKKS